MTSLAAVLIVRDEQELLASCLASLQGTVDAVHVHDTGSSDDTVDIALSGGAHVTHGAWTDDFAAARNEATSNCDADWVLSIDADEILVADPGFRSLLGDGDAFDVEIHVEHDQLPYDFIARRLFRPQFAQWRGRVHEQLVARSRPLRLGVLPPAVIRLVHSGYADNASRTTSAERNAAIAVAIVESGEADARTYLDLGRSCVVLGRGQDAADAFEAVRSRYPGTHEWIESTDFLARLCLAEAMYGEALALADQLRAVGARGDYCDWLEAQARVQLGEFDRAGALLDGVDQVIDTARRAQSDVALAELKSIVARLRDLG